jgi:hypothetical protein
MLYMSSCSPPSDHHWVICRQMTPTKIGLIVWGLAVLSLVVMLASTIVKIILL